MTALCTIVFAILSIIYATVGSKTGVASIETWFFDSIIFLICFTACLIADIVWSYKRKELQYFEEARKKYEKLNEKLEKEKNNAFGEMLSSYIMFSEGIKNEFDDDF